MPAKRGQGTTHAPACNFAPTASGQARRCTPTPHSRVKTHLVTPSEWQSAERCSERSEGTWAQTAGTSRWRARLPPSHLERRLATTPGRTSSQLSWVLRTRVVSWALTARAGALQFAPRTWRVGAQVTRTVSFGLRPLAGGELVHLRLDTCRARGCCVAAALPVGLPAPPRSSSRPADGLSGTGPRRARLRGRGTTSLGHGRYWTAEGGARCDGNPASGFGKPMWYQSGTTPTKVIPQWLGAQHSPSQRQFPSLLFSCQPRLVYYTRYYRPDSIGTISGRANSRSKLLEQLLAESVSVSETHWPVR